MHCVEVKEVYRINKVPFECFSESFPPSPVLVV